MARLRQPVRMPAAKLRKLALAGADARPWYDWALAEIQAAAPILGVTETRLADLLALFSPRTSVKKSVRLTVHYIRTGGHVHDVLPMVRVGVAYYEATREIRGCKTAPFAKALMGDKSAVVLDTWMAVAFGVDPNWIKDRPKLRRRMAATLQRVADSLGWPVAETQAAIWAATVRGQGPYAKLRTIGLLEEINRPAEVDDLPI